MRIAKNETAHAIWLKFSTIARFIDSSTLLLSRVRFAGAVRKALESVKICKVGLLTDRRMQRQR